ncbi:MAG TPA: hypothetical protein VLK26_09360 [Rudaea sp.]|nr:hypothetical protein [Rudaea sp.]
MREIVAPPETPKVRRLHDRDSKHDCSGGRGHGEAAYIRFGSGNAKAAVGAFTFPNHS